MRIEKLDHGEEKVRRRLLAFLRPHEAECLFLTGNLKNRFPGTHLYAAREAGEWLGVGGYYEEPRAVVLGAAEDAAARELASELAGRHPDLQSLCAPAGPAAAACRVLAGMGWHHAEDPRCLLMELDSPPPPQEFEGLVRPIRLGDHIPVVKLLRQIHNRPPGAPVTEHELRALMMNPLCLVLDAGSGPVATAQTNGMGIAAFQILGVATDPAHRNRGYARAVCASLIRAMWSRGARRAVLFTGRDNPAALGCYRRIGFRTVGEYWVARLVRGGERVSTPW
jgi:GNAT superfamily N-acetyltransferase